MPKINQRAPGFSLPATGDQTLSLADFKGQRVVLYFYPKDSTPGCTREGQDFRDHHDDFAALNTVILGVSRDKIRSHENFKAKQEFPFELLSDSEEELCQAYDVIKDKNMYGRVVRGIERSTFLIDEKGKLRAEWRKVKVPGHVEAVLEAVRELDG
ncbi:MAG: peroxiredoxin [Wenzhouxiangellaceae bacterium]